MKVTSEDLPLICICLLGVYSLYRLIATFFMTGKQSICQYWSRFCFRLIFLAHVCFNIMANLRQASTVVSSGIIMSSSHIAQFILCLSLAFLVASLQDFVCYSNKDPTFIKRNWFWIVSPFIISSGELQYLRYYSSVTIDTEVNKLVRFIYEGVLLLFTLSFIALPALFFMSEIRKNDFSGSLTCKINVATVFFVLEMFLLVANAVIEVVTINSPLPRDLFLIFRSSRDPIILMICFTQDMIDWMLKWLYLDEDAINDEDEYEKNRKEPLQIELYQTDV